MRKYSNYFILNQLVNQPVIQKELHLQQLTNKFSFDRHDSVQSPDFDIQSVHDQDEYEAVSDVLEQRGIYGNKPNWSNDE